MGMKYLRGLSLLIHYGILQGTFNLIVLSYKYLLEVNIFFIKSKQIIINNKKINKFDPLFILLL